MERSNDGVGKCIWVVPEGYIPDFGHGPRPEMESHETLCVLNTSSVPAKLEITIYFADRDPAGPYRMEVGPRRTLHLRLNELSDPEPMPMATDFSSVIRSNIPIVVQHTRLDSRQSENALLSTIAYGE